MPIRIEQTKMPRLSSRFSFFHRADRLGLSQSKIQNLKSKIPLFLLVLLTAFVVVGCDSSDTMTEEEVFEPRVGRGATLSLTLVAEKSVAQINSEFAALNVPVTARFAVSIYKVVYQTIDAEGAVTQASGALLVPRDAAGALPLVSYQHGTLVARDEVPSAGSAEQTVGLAFATDG